MQNRRNESAVHSANAGLRLRAASAKRVSLSTDNHFGATSLNLDSALTTNALTSSLMTAPSYDYRTF